MTVKKLVGELTKMQCQALGTGDLPEVKRLASLTQAVLAAEETVKAKADKEFENAGG